MKTLCVVVLATAPMALLGCDRLSAAPDELPNPAVSPTDDLTPPRHGVPAIAGFGMHIEVAGGDIVLGWDDQGSTYSVWRSTTPYFNPGDPDAVLLASELTDPNYVDVGGNDDTSYYYRVESVGGISTICGKYVQQIVPGYNKVAQPVISGITSAAGFASSFEHPISAAYKWHPDKEYYSHWFDFFDPTWDIFDYGLGDCPIAQPASGVGPFMHKTVGQLPDYGEMEIALHPGHNYVTVPLHMGDLTASELLQQLPAGATVAAFTPYGPGEPYGGGAEGDFAIVAGSCVSVSVTSAATWPPPFDPLPTLDDDFGGGTLSGWTEHNGGGATVTVEDGHAIIDPDPRTQWYNNDEAYHLCKPVSGDFCVTASMSVTNAAGGATYPGATLRIGGLMIRDPDSDVPNTYHVGLGVLIDPEMCFEHKSTVSGVSTVGATPYPSTDGDLRVCRLGDEVYGLLREPGGSWELMHQVSRPDLPDSLLAGPIAYGNQEDDDLLCSCDYVGFQSITEAAEITDD